MKKMQFRTIRLLALVSSSLFFVGCNGSGPIEDSISPSPLCPKDSVCQQLLTVTTCLCVPSHPDENDIATRLYNDLLQAASSSPDRVINASVTLWDYLPVTPDINKIESEGVEVYWMAPRAIPGYLETHRSSTSTATLYERIKQAAAQRQVSVLASEHFKSNPLWVDVQEAYAKQILDNLATETLEISTFRITGTAEKVRQYWIDNSSLVRVLKFKFHPQESYWAADPDKDIGRRYQE